MNSIATVHLSMLLDLPLLSKVKFTFQCGSSPHAATCMLAPRQPIPCVSMERTAHVKGQSELFWLQSRAS